MIASFSWESPADVASAIGSAVPEKELGDAGEIGSGMDAGEFASALSHALTEGGGFVDALSVEGALAGDRERKALRGKSGGGPFIRLPAASAVTGPFGPQAPADTREAGPHWHEPPAGASPRAVPQRAGYPTAEPVQSAVAGDTAEAKVRPRVAEQRVVFVADDVVPAVPGVAAEPNAALPLQEETARSMPGDAGEAEPHRRVRRGTEKSEPTPPPPPARGAERARGNPLPSEGPELERSESRGIGKDAVGRAARGPNVATGPREPERYLEMRGGNESAREPVPLQTPPVLEGGKPPVPVRERAPTPVHVAGAPVQVASKRSVPVPAETPAAAPRERSAPQPAEPSRIESAPFSDTALRMEELLAEAHRMGVRVTLSRPVSSEPQVTSESRGGVETEQPPGTLPVKEARVEPSSPPSEKKLELGAVDARLADAEVPGEPSDVERPDAAEVKRFERGEIPRALRRSSPSPPPTARVESRTGGALGKARRKAPVRADVDAPSREARATSQPEALRFVSDRPAPPRPTGGSALGYRVEPAPAVPVQPVAPAASPSVPVERPHQGAWREAPVSLGRDPESAGRPRGATAHQLVLRFSEDSRDETRPEGVRVVLRTLGEKVHARFVAEGADAQARLREALPELRQLLVRRGLEPASVDVVTPVNADGRRDGSRHGTREDDGPPRRSPWAESEGRPEIEAFRSRLEALAAGLGPGVT